MKPLFTVYVVQMGKRNGDGIKKKYFCLFKDSFLNHRETNEYSRVPSKLVSLPVLYFCDTNADSGLNISLHLWFIVIL